MLVHIMTSHDGHHASAWEESEALPRKTASTIVQKSATVLYIVRSVLVSPGTNVRPVSGFVMMVRSSFLAARIALPVAVLGSAAPVTSGSQHMYVASRDMTDLGLRCYRKCIGQYT